MAYQQKENTGSLFKNDRRETDSHPNAKGTALIDGVEYWMDAWTNETGYGTKYQSVKFKRKEQSSAPPQRPQPAAFDTDLDDDVPF